MLVYASRILAPNEEGEDNAIEIGGGASKGKRNGKGPEDLSVRRGENCRQLNDGPDRGQNRASHGRQKKLRLCGCPCPHGADCCRAGNEARREAGDRKAQTGASEPYRDVAEGPDCHDEDDDDPYRVRIKSAERPHLLIWQNWQDDQCGGSKGQAIPNLIFGQNGTRKTVKRLTRIE